MTAKLRASEPMCLWPLSKTSFSSPSWRAQEGSGGADSPPPWIDWFLDGLGVRPATLIAEMIAKKAEKFRWQLIETRPTRALAWLQYCYSSIIVPNFSRKVAMRMAFIVSILMATSIQGHAATKTPTPTLNDIATEAAANWKTTPAVAFDVLARWELKPDDYTMVKELSYILQTNPNDPQHDELYAKWNGELGKLEVIAANTRNQADERMYKVLRQLLILNRFVPAVRQ